MAKRGKSKERSNGQGTIRQLEDGRWWGQVTAGQIEYYPNGEIRKQPRKSKTFDKKGDLLAWMNEQQDLKHKNLAVVTDQTRFGKYIKDWLVTYKKTNLKAKTYESYEHLINKYIVTGSIAGIKVQELQTAHLQKFYSNLFTTGGENKQGLSSRTVRYIHTLIHAALKQARKEKFVFENVAEYVELPKDKTVKTKDAYTVEEIKALLSTAKGTLRTLILFSVVTGLRRGELLALTWDDIDFEKGTVTVRRSLSQLKNSYIVQDSTKTEKGIRIVSINHPELLDILTKIKQKQEKIIDKKGYQNPDNVVFSNRIDREIKANKRKGIVAKPSTLTMQRVHPTNFSHSFLKVAKKAGVRSLGVHALRHTNGTFISNSGIPLATLQNHLGHSDISTTGIYLHPDIQQAENCLTVVANLIL